MDQVQLSNRVYVLGRRILIVCIVMFCILTPAMATTYITADKAFKGLIPQAEKIIEKKIELSGTELEMAIKKLGNKFTKRNYNIYEAFKDGQVIAGGIILHVKGKEQPITFMVAVGPDESIIGMELLVFRESQGAEIRHKKFLKQFVKKMLKDKIRLNRNINAISGATISSRAAVYAAKKAISILSVVQNKEAVN